MSLRNVNLNLLPVLRALLRHQSVSAAAEELGLTQPAVSAALARLRISLKDPLLVKIGRQMDLTGRARDLIRPVEEACIAIETVWNNRVFDPRSAQRSFVIASADHGPLIIAAPVIRKLGRTAPGIVLHFIDFSLDHLIKPHMRGTEFLIAPRTVFSGLEHEALTIVQLTPPDDFVGVIGPHHRLAAKSGFTAKDRSEARYVIFHPGPLREAELSDLIGGHRPNQIVIARFPQFTILPVIAALTDAIAIVPRRVANRMHEIMEIRILDDTFHAPPTDLCLAWSPVFDGDPAHQWLRNLILTAVQDEPLDQA